MLTKTHMMLRTKLSAGETELPMLVSNILEAATTAMTVYLSLVEAAAATTTVANTTAITTETTATVTGPSPPAATAIANTTKASRLTRGTSSGPRAMTDTAGHDGDRSLACHTGRVVNN